MVEEGDLIIEVGSVTLIKDYEGSFKFFCAINFIYLTVGYFVFLRFAVETFALFKLPTDDERLADTDGCYCFFILEGGSICPEPNEFGFFDILIFLVNY